MGYALFNLWREFMKTKIKTLIMTMLFMGVFIVSGLTVCAANDGYYTYTISNGEATITDCDSEIGSTTIPNTLGGYPVTSIGYMAFYNCDNLGTITIPKSITKIGERAFESCDKLSYILIPDSVASIGQRAFYNCDNLRIISLPKGITSIGDNTFYDCDSLTSIIIPDGVTNVGYKAFYSCDSLASVTIPNSIISIEGNAFYNCSNLYEVSITEMESWCNIDFADVYSNPLYYAQKLCLDGKLVSEVVIPDNVKSIENYAFYNCNSITSIIIGNGVSNIGRSAFSNCTNLNKITLPKTITFIDQYAFSKCESLSIYYIGTQDEWENVSIATNNDDLLNATIYYMGNFAIIDYDVVINAAKIVAPETGIYTIIFADYNSETNSLSNIETATITFTKETKGTVVDVPITKGFSLNIGDKIMLWSDFTNLVPKCEAYIVK